MHEPPIRLSNDKYITNSSCIKYDYLFIYINKDYLLIL